MKKKVHEKIRKVLTSYDEFEKIINFRQVFGFDNDKLIRGNSDHKRIYKSVVYTYSLEVLYLMTLKIGASNSIQEFIDLTKFVVQYKHSSIAMRKLIMVLIIQ